MTFKSRYQIFWLTILFYQPNDLLPIFLRVRLTAKVNDNALAETINGLYKTELIRKRAPWKYRETVELLTLEWMAWFNHHRLLEPIGYTTSRS